MRLNGWPEANVREIQRPAAVSPPEALQLYRNQDYIGFNWIEKAYLTVA